MGMDHTAQFSKLGEHVLVLADLDFPVFRVPEKMKLFQFHPIEAIHIATHTGRGAIAA